MARPVSGRRGYEDKEGKGLGRMGGGPLSGVISDAACGQVTSYRTYETARAGRHVIVVHLATWQG